jgi:HSP20 family molecular chaperone IbpA
MKYYYTSNKVIDELCNAIFQNTFETTLNVDGYAYCDSGRWKVSEKEAVFTVDMPGVKKENVEVSINAKKLTIEIKATREGYRDQKYFRQFANVKFGTPTCSLVDGVFTFIITFEQGSDTIIKIKP